MNRKDTLPHPRAPLTPARAYTNLLDAIRHAPEEEWETSLTNAAAAFGAFMRRRVDRALVTSVRQPAPQAHFTIARLLKPYGFTLASRKISNTDLYAVYAVRYEPVTPRSDRHVNERAGGVWVPV